MAASRTRVVGPVGLPDGSNAPDGAIIRFTLPDWDRDGTSVIVKGRTETTVADGEIDVSLWQTATGGRSLSYDVSAVYHNDFEDRRVETYLGKISLTGPGPVTLADMLSLPAPVPDVPDALAQARASALAAAEAANLSDARAGDAEAIAARIDLGALDAAVAQTGDDMAAAAAQASLAADQVTLASAERDGAEVAKIAAQAAKALAEAARDATLGAATSAGAFADTTLSAAVAAGVAATTSGQFFMATGDDVSYIGLYERGSSSAAKRAELPKASATADRHIPIVTLQSTGTATAQTVTLPDGVTIKQGLEVLWYADATNTGPMTLNGLPVVTEGGQPLTAGIVVSSRPTQLRCSNGGVEWRIITRGTWDFYVTQAIASKPERFFTLSLVSSTGGTANAQTADAPAGMTGNSGNQTFMWMPNAANTEADPTLDIGGFGARIVKASNGGALAPGDISSNTLYLVRMNAADSLRLIGVVPSGITAAVNTALARRAKDTLAVGVNLADWQAFSGRQVAYEFDRTADGLPIIRLPSGSSPAGDIHSIPRAAVNSDKISGGITVMRAVGSTRFVIRQMNASAVEIRDTGDGNGDYRSEISITSGLPEGTDISILDKPIAPDCTEIRIYAGVSGGGELELAKPWLGTGRSFSFPTPDFYTAGRVAYVAADGVLGNDGLVASRPMASVRAALASGASTIIMRGGLYSHDAGLIDGRLFGGVDIIAYPSEMPIVRGGDIVTGFTAVAGTDHVYSAALATAPALHHATTPAGFVWIIGLPHSEISASDRRAAHRGRSHRMPHTPLYAGPTSLATLDAATRPSWWWASGVLYINVAGLSAVDPASVAIRIPRGDAFPTRRLQNHLGLQGITYEMMGASMDNARGYDFEGVVNIGAPTDGFSFDKVSGTDRYCTVLGAGNDNWNGHGQSDAAIRTDGYASIDYRPTSFEPYSAFAWDDGRSLHERGHGRVHGGLTEYCGSTAFAPAGGAEEVYYDHEIAYCGWNPNSGGEKAGVAAVNTVSDDGTGCRVECHRVVVRDMPRGFYVGVGASHRMILQDCLTINCGEHAMYVSTVGAQIIHRNLRDIGSAALKGGPGAAGIIAENGTLVA